MLLPSSKAKQSRGKQSKAKQSRAKQSKAKQSKAKQSKAKQSKPSRYTNHALTICIALPNCNCAAVIGSANRNPPRSFSCLGVAQPSVVRDMRWLYVLHGAAHANWGLSIPLWGLKNQVLRKSEKCNTFQAKLGFSWLRVARTRTLSICAGPTQK